MDAGASFVAVGTDLMLLRAALEGRFWTNCDEQFSVIIWPYDIGISIARS